MRSGDRRENTDSKRVRGIGSTPQAEPGAFIEKVLGTEAVSPEQGITNHHDTHVIWAHIAGVDFFCRNPKLCGKFFILPCLHNIDFEICNLCGTEIPDNLFDHRGFSGTRGSCDCDEPDVHASALRDAVRSSPERMRSRSFIISASIFAICMRAARSSSPGVRIFSTAPPFMTIRFSVRRAT